MEDELSARAVEVLDDACQKIPGNAWYRVPNHRVYPHQWLWDSCFHAVALCAVGQLEPAVQELEALFSAQTEQGFVPHMVYHQDQEAARLLWGRTGRSTITQPPMYGHALRVIAEAVAADSDAQAALEERVSILCTKASLGLEWLFRHRVGSDGLLVIVHPWETSDNSPRFDGHMEGEWTRERWDARKLELLETLQDGVGNDEGASVSNAQFRLRSAMFNALVAFNALELAEVTGDERLGQWGGDLAVMVDSLWDEELGTWCDKPDADEHQGMDESKHDGVWRSGRTRVANALFAALVTENDDYANWVFDQLVDPEAFGAAFGPTEVHRQEASFDPVGYWRGGTWPQNSYLLWLAASRRGHACAEQLGAQLQAGVLGSGFAEYWHPDTHQGLGAVPCTWATIAVAVGRTGQ